MYQRHQSDSGEIHVTFDKLLRSFYAKFTSDISHAHDIALVFPQIMCFLPILGTEDIHCLPTISKVFKKASLTSQVQR